MSEASPVDSGADPSTTAQPLNRAVMSPLFRVLFQWKCTSTHHKLAMEGLYHLRLDGRERWTNLFLHEINQYLDGAKAPDKKFKDFRNHVLHVSDNYRGGAVKTAEVWYERLVGCLQAQEWTKAVYVAGVLSHYCTDPWMPLHTGQSEAESQMHRACEWSVAKSYDALRERIAPDWPEESLPNSAEWLRETIEYGAELAHEQYDRLVTEYDLDAGVKRPEAGLTEPLQAMLADLLACCGVMWSRILERAFLQAGTKPPKCDVSLDQVIARLSIPIYWVQKKLTDVRDRELVRAIYDELQETGQVDRYLPEDDRRMREDWRARTHRPSSPPNPVVPPEVESEPSSDPPISAAPEPLFEPVRSLDAGEPAESLTEEPTHLRFYLEREKPVEDAPSIGKKTARRLAAIGVTTVADLLTQDAEQASDVLGVRYITADLFADWQSQAELVCRIPGLRGHDAQFLVACGVTDPEDLTDIDAETLLEAIGEFLQTREGERVLRGGTPPDRNEVEGWIAMAKQARTLDAA